MAVGAGLGHLVVFAGLLHGEVAPSLQALYFGRKSLRSPHPGVGSWRLLEGEIATEFIWNSSAWEMFRNLIKLAYYPS